MNSREKWHASNYQTSQGLWSLNKVKKIAQTAVLGLLLAGSAADTYGKPLSPEEELSRTKRSNTDLLKHTAELQQKIKETNAELQALLEGFEKNMPEGIPGKPDTFMGSDGHVTSEARAWIVETLPKEHTKLLEDLKKAEKNMDSVPAWSHAWWHHWQTVFLAIYAILATIGAVMAIPPIGTGMGHWIVLAAVHGWSKWWGKRKPKKSENDWNQPPPLPPA